MQNIPPELNFQIWKDLPTESILNLCETNSEFKQICDSEYTWRYLLKRDFKLDYQGYDPKLKYIVVYGQNKIIQKVNQEIRNSQVKRKKITFDLKNKQLLNFDIKTFDFIPV